MPITFETKFDIGAVVYRADVEGKRRVAPCPDCLGARKWQAISPAGRGYTFDCPRCASSFISDKALDLGFWVYEPRVEKRTLVAFRGISDRGGEWFAAEDSSGGPGANRSGTIHCDDTLFATETEATIVAQQKALDATDRNRKNPDVAEARLLQLRVCDYQIDQAKSAAGDTRATLAQYKLEDFLNELVPELLPGAPRLAEDVLDRVKAITLENFPQYFEAGVFKS